MILGKKDEIEKVVFFFEMMIEVIMVFFLNVSGVFYFRYMNKVKEEFE